MPDPDRPRDEAPRRPVKHRHPEVIASFRVSAELAEAIRREADERGESVAVTLRAVLSDLLSEQWSKYREENW